METEEKRKADRVVQCFVVGASSTKDTVTWIVVYSTSPVHFHVVSDKSSEWAIAKIFERAGRQANCNFNYTVHYVEDMLNPLHAVLAQQVRFFRQFLFC